MSVVQPVSKQALRIFAWAIGLLLPAGAVKDASAQDTGGAGPTDTSGSSSSGTASGGTSSGGAASGGGASSSGGGAQGGSVQNTSTVTFFPGGVAPTPPGQTLGGGNVQFSSSKPITGNETDSFDFKRGGNGDTVHGSPDGSFVFESSGEPAVRGGTNANVHVVRKGDTLWDICDSYFQNPYQWPRIWSYNPQIQNPHWIYPGDRVNLRGETGLATRSALLGTKPTPTTSLVERGRKVAANTIFLREEGYIDDEDDRWGDIMGSREDKMFLADFDEVYLRIGKNHEPKIGQELTIYRPIRRVGKKGQLVAIQGTAKIDRFDEKTRIARARITETLDVIERGALVGPVDRAFDVVPPVTDQVDVNAKIIGSIVPHELYGQNQVLFIDKGEDAGLVAGNRLIVVSRGDEWHKSFTTRSSVRRIALEDPSPAAMETVPGPDDDKKLPEEVQAELRVIRVRKNSSMVLVTASRREIEPGETAVARKGY